MHIHTIAPVFSENSKILILGSFPSVLSRETGFFYGHPQNRFWSVISHVFECELPKGIEEKKALLHSCNIALWDVIQSCDIKGSSDSSIKNVVPNDIKMILDVSDIGHIFANGQTAGRLYMKYIFPKTSIPITVLPSTSPANAAYSLERLCRAWKKICEE